MRGNRAQAVPSPSCRNHMRGRAGLALLVALTGIGCAHSAPQPGTPEHSRACANLVASVQLIDRLYPAAGPDPWARAAFFLQAQAFALEFECGPIGLPTHLEPERRP